MQQTCSERVIHKRARYALLGDTHHLDYSDDDSTTYEEALKDVDMESDGP